MKRDGGIRITKVYGDVYCFSALDWY